MKTKRFGISGFCLIWLLICLPSIRSYASFSYDVTRIDDNLKATADYIRDNFDENYVVVLDWTYGYYFAYETGHTVLVDGGGGAKMRYWVYEALMSKDEKFASGILKRLAGYTVDGRFFEGIEEKLGGELEGMKFIRRSAMLDREEAMKVLEEEYELNQEDIDEILSRLYSDKKVILAFSDSMMDTGQIAMYYHCWNFEKLDSVCSDEDNMKAYAKEKRLVVEDSDNYLKVRSSYDDEIISSKLYERKDEELKYFDLKEKFVDKVGIENFSVWVVK